jgi:Nif-specific regulatory protein
VIRADDLMLGERSPSAAPAGVEEADFPATLTLAEVEARHIGRVLRAVGGHMGEAAHVLGIHRNTLTRKVREAGLGEVAE